MKVGIVTHYFVYGSCQALHEYLVTNNHNVTLLEIPLDMKGQEKSEYRITLNNNLKIKTLFFFMKNTKSLISKIA